MPDPTEMTTEYMRRRAAGCRQDAAKLYDTGFHDIARHQDACGLQWETAAIICERIDGCRDLSERKPATEEETT